MSEYVRITDRKIELTDEGVEELMGENTPTTDDIRSYYRGSSVSRGDEFDRWLAQTISEEREAERQGIIDMVLEMRQYAVEGDDLEGICRVYEALIERDDK